MDDQTPEPAGPESVSWPQPLATVHGPFSEERLDGAVDGMGAHGRATAALAAAGFVQPDLITGMTLFLLARQPRSAPKDPSRPAKASPIAGGVWVREQFTIHRPLPRAERFEVTGSSTGRYVRKGRRYGTNECRAVDEAGNLVSTNLTTGLLSYRAESGRADEVEGLPLEQTPAPEPDWNAAASNPHVEAIRSAAAGTKLGGQEMTITLAMMAARDTSKPDNPIHSDPEQAKQAGLQKPIAGGSHVLAFAIEPLLDTWGVGSLSHGAKFDVRWRAPTEADAVIVPTATIAEVLPDRVVVDVAVDLVASGAQAMVGSVIVPLP